MSASRRALAALVLLLAVGATPGVAKPKKVVCKPGKATLVLGAKTSCVAPTKILAKPSGREVTTAALGAFGIDMVLNDPLARLVPKRLRPARTNARRALKRLRTKLPSATAVATAAGIDFTPGSTTTSTGADGSTSTSTRADFHDGDTGAKGTAEASVDQSADGTSSVTLDLGLTDRAGSGGAFSITMPVEREIHDQAKCPTAAGAIDRRRIDHMAVRTHQTRPSFGVSFIDQNVRYQGEATLHGHVDANAALASADYSAGATLNIAYEAKALGGLLHADTQVELEVKASGTLDGRTGARRTGETTITGRGRARGVSKRAVAADVAKLIQDPKLRNHLTQLLSDNIDGAFKNLKKAEAGWQAPNACAVMRLNPETGPAAGLDQGESATVTGQVEAARTAGGGQADGRWTMTQLLAGSQNGLPGSSAAGAPVTVKVTATQDVDANTIAAGVRLHVTSPAGVAELAWSTGGRDDGPPFYYRIVAGSGTQVVSGRRTTSAGFHIDQTAPVSFSWTLRTTSGAPDGRVDVEGGWPSGQVESGEDQVTEASWTWRTDEDGGHTHVVAGLTTDGPAVTFDPPDGDRTKLTPYWTNLGIPDFQYSVDIGAPDGNYNTLGPDCAPRYADLTTAPLPLSTFAQRRFTVTIDKDWDVDQNVSRLGHDACHGHLTASMTLERVRADGSPLP